MKIEDLFESKASIPMLLFLKERGNSTISEMIRGMSAGQTAIYNAIMILKKFNLVEEEVRTDFPFKRTSKLTPLGEKVAEKLDEVEKLLRSSNII